ncbi:hypothetical protein B0H21DRAFT_671322, partial [Amylocystis lapponica]
SMPFIHGIALCTTTGEATRVKGLFDDGAMVSVMCRHSGPKSAAAWGPSPSSSRILRVANGVVAPSSGSWTGDIVVGGARVRGSFEVFPRGGAWSFLAGKPLLEAFKASHNYDGDTIAIPKADGSCVV